MQSKNMNKQGDFIMERNSRKIELLFLLMTAIMLIGTTSIFASNLRLIKEKSIQTKPGENLSVDASGADIKVETWDKNEAYVKIFGNRKAEEKMHFEIEKAGDGVKVVAKRRGSSWFNWWGDSGYSVRIEIMLPSKYNTDIETSGGDITLYNLIGENNLNTSGGDVKVMSTTGELMVETSGGDITIDQHKGNSRLSTSGGDINTLKLVGNLKATTSGGDVRVEVSDGSILAKTSGGNIDISYYGNNKGIEARTSGGSIHARIPSSFKADVFLETSGGDIESNFSNSRTSKVSRSTLKAEYNSGGESFICKTSGGSIVVNER